MVNLVIACNTCNAEFTIKHDMLEQTYIISFCPFCGEDIDEENVEEHEKAEW